MIDHLKNTITGLRDTLESAPSLNGYLSRVSMFYDHNAPVERGKATLHIVVGDTTGYEPITDESSNTDIMPTNIAVIMETNLQDDADAFISETRPSLLDLEFRVHQALQSADYWGTDGDNHGWEIASITRDDPVLLPEGGLDPERRRTIIELTVDVSYDREDGPAR